MIQRTGAVALLAVLAACLAAGCRATVTSEVVIGTDGSGTVRAGVGLDDEAMDRVGDLAGKLRVEDLRQAGWSVVGPSKEGDGLTWVRASKPFADPGQGVAVLAELSGPNGPFRDLRLRQDQSFFHARTAFSGVIDLSEGLRGFVDPDLEQRLGAGLGLDVEALRQRFGESLGEVVRVELVARLPGSITADGGDDVDGGVTWVAEPGQRVEMVAGAEALKLVPWLPAIGALTAVGLAVGVVVWRRARVGV